MIEFITIVLSAFCIVWFVGMPFAFLISMFVFRYDKLLTTVQLIFVSCGLACVWPAVTVGAQIDACKVVYNKIQITGGTAQK